MMNTYWVDISIPGGFTKVIKVRAKSIKHAVKVAEQKLFNFVTIHVSETFETATKRK